ncbi:MAG: DUF58 domain-containing protein [Thermodesulfobacteriota bacterium]
MSIGPVLSAPLPWLTMLAGRLFGKPPAPPTSAPKRRPFWKLPRSISFTREGWRFIAVLLLIGAAAINTGNNLLYLVVAMLLSLIIISGIMSESTLRKVRVRRELPRRVFKGKPAVVDLHVKNEKRLFASYSLLLAESAAPEVRSETAYLLKLSAGEETVCRSKYTFRTRGVHRLGGVGLRTRFPFGLFLKGRTEWVEDEVIVYPAANPIRLRGRDGGALTGAAQTVARGGGTPDSGQLYSLRDYTFMDDARLIHWRSTARTLKLMRREFEKETERRLFIVFDNYRDEDPEVFERAVEEAASAARYFIEEGAAVGLRTLTRELRPAAGREQLMRILHTLALIEPAEGEGAPSVRTVT